MTTSNFFYILIFLISFSITYFMIQWSIPKLLSNRIIGVDMNKPDRPQIPEMGGLSVAFGFFLGTLFLFSSFLFFDNEIKISPLFGISLIILVCILSVGIADDLLDIRQYQKALLPFFLSIPLGFFVSDSMFVPMMGELNFGAYIVLLVPLGITCAANSMNMLEGFNGLSSGLGIIIVSSLIVIGIIDNSTEGFIFLVPLLGGLIAFLYFNKYPAKIFPGDTLTIFMGAVIALSAILSNHKFEGFILFLPFIIEFFLKLRGKFRGQCFAQSIDQGILIYHGRIESLTHLVMKSFRVNEKRLVNILWTFQLIIALVVISTINMW